MTTTNETSFDPLLVEQKGRVRILAMNNPGKRNAISEGLYQAIYKQLEEAKNDPNTGAIILTGADGYFCSGGDLTKIATRRDKPIEERRRMLDGLHDLIRAMRNFEKPIIAAVEGGAAGAGFSLAAAADLIVAAKGARFSVAYVKVGLSPDGGITSFMAQALPRQLVTELCLTGQPIYAERLHELGMVNHVADAADVQKVALEIAENIATGPTLAMTAIKALCRSAYELDLDAQLDAEAVSMVEAQGTEESAEGITAFFNKRQPNYHA